MRSFVFILIAAALATLGSTAPVGGLPSTGTTAVTDAIPIHAQGVDSEITDAVGSILSKSSDVHARAAPSSVVAIFESVSSSIELYTEQLSYLVASNCSTTEVADVVDSIKLSITAAIPQVQALAGQKASVVLAAATGDVELTVAEVADIVGGTVNLALTAVGHVQDVINVIGDDIVGEVEDILVDLGHTVCDLVSATDAIVYGLSTSLAVVVASVASVIYELNLTDLAVAVGLKA